MKINDLYRLTGVSPLTLRVGLQQGRLPFGTAFIKPGNQKYTYVLYDAKVQEFFGLTDEQMKSCKKGRSHESN